MLVRRIEAVRLDLLSYTAEESLRPRSDAGEAGAVAHSLCQGSENGVKRTWCIDDHILRVGCMGARNGTVLMGVLRQAHLLDDQGETADSNIYKGCCSPRTGWDARLEEFNVSAGQGWVV